MKINEFAQEAFKAYNESAGGKTWDGRPIPTWEEVGDKVRSHWIAAVRKVIELAQHNLTESIYVAPDGDNE